MPAETKTRTDQRLQLDERAIEAAKRDSEEGAVTPAYGPWRDEIVRLLNDALATELVCVLRYRRHYFTAQGRDSPKIAEEFLVHANEELAHADQIAERIVQLGGDPDFKPDTLLQRSHSDYDDVVDPERDDPQQPDRRAGGDRDLSPDDRADRRQGSDHAPHAGGILSVEEEHADELRDWLGK